MQVLELTTSNYIPLIWRYSWLALENESFSNITPLLLSQWLQPGLLPFFNPLTLKTFTPLSCEPYKLLLYSSSEYSSAAERHCHNCFEKPAITYYSSATKNLYQKMWSQNIQLCYILQQNIFLKLGLQP